LFIVVVTIIDFLCYFMHLGFVMIVTVSGSPFVGCVFRDYRGSDVVNGDKREALDAGAGEKASGPCES
jgi:hypothetical protein